MKQTEQGEIEQVQKTAEELFDEGYKRYKEGEGPDTLVPLFKEICDRAPKNSNAWTSLAWLYLLQDKPQQAYKAAKSAVKLNSDDPQARINLAMAMLELGKTGVRDHIEVATQMVMASSEWLEEVEKNIEEGLARKPGWKSLLRVKRWLFEI